jgi:hypothetical protein
MIGAMPLLDLILFLPSILIAVVQSIIIALDRGGSAPGEPIIDRAIELNAPAEVTEGKEFQVSATLDGEPLSGALITLKDETVTTDSHGNAVLRAPDVTEDTSYLIEAGGSAGKGSTTVLVRDTSGHF